MSDLLDVTVSVIRRSSGRYTASVSRFTVDVEFQNDDLHRLIVDMQRHLRQVAMFHLRAAGGVVGDSSTPWMKELEAIDNEDNRELRIARQEALALHIADLEAELAEKQPTVEMLDTEIGPMRRGRFPEGWTMPEPPYEGCRPVAEDIGGGWLLQWFDEDDCYAGEIPWPVGPAEAVALEDLEAAGFVIGLGGEE